MFSYNICTFVVILIKMMFPAYFTFQTFDVHGTRVPSDTCTTTQVTETVIECVDKGRGKVCKIFILARSRRKIDILFPMTVQVSIPVLCFLYLSCLLLFI